MHGVHWNKLQCCINTSDPIFFWCILWFSCHTMIWGLHNNFTWKLVRASMLIIYTGFEQVRGSTHHTCAYSVNYFLKSNKFVGRKCWKFHFNRRRYIRFYFWLLISFHSLLPFATLLLCGEITLAAICGFIFFKNSFHSIPFFMRLGKELQVSRTVSRFGHTTIVSLRLTTRNYHSE